MPHGAAELVLGLAEQHQGVLLVVRRQGVRDGLRNVLDDTEHTNNRGRQDRGLAGLVVEGDVAAGDRDFQFGGAVCQAVDCFAELPHHVRVFRGAEVQAVGYCERGGAGDGDVAVGLCQCQACAHVRVQVGVAARCVGGDSNAAVGLLVDTQHTGVSVLGLHGVAAHVAVVLFGDEVARAQRRGGDHLQPGILDVRLLIDDTTALHLIQPRRTCVRAFVDRALVNR